MRSKAPAEDVRRALSRVLNRPVEHDLRITLSEQQSERGTLRALFQDGRTPITAMTWFMCFCSMLAIYFLISWLQTLIRMAGMPRSEKPTSELQPLLRISYDVFCFTKKCKQHTTYCPL